MPQSPFERFLRNVSTPQHPHKRIKKLGAKLAEFAVKHPRLRFTLEEASDARRLLPYLTPYAVEVLCPVAAVGTLPELQFYLDCKVVTNLIKLLEGLVYVCIPTHLDDVCEENLLAYFSAFAALTRIAEQARAQGTPQGKAVALKLLDQLQPENHEQAPGMPYNLGLSRVRALLHTAKSCKESRVHAGSTKQNLYVCSGMHMGALAHHQSHGKAGICIGPLLYHQSWERAGNSFAWCLDGAFTAWIIPMASILIHPLLNERSYGLQY
jgi:hypothetical protein